MKNLTYEEYKTNYNKLTKSEINAKEHREFRDRMLREAALDGLKRLKDNMKERIKNFKSKILNEC